MRTDQATGPGKRNIFEDDFRGLCIPAVTDEGQEGGDVYVSRAGVLAGRGEVSKARACKTFFFFEVTEKLLLPFFEQGENRHPDPLLRIAVEGFSHTLKRRQVIPRPFTFPNLSEQPDDAGHGVALGSLVILDAGIEGFYGPGNEAPVYW
jgi:hypothetical protein